MKKLLLFLTSVVVLGSFSYAQVKIVAAYNYPPKDSILAGLKSIRGVNYAANPFGDGTPAIVATNYYDKGHVNVFIPIGDDSLQLVWTSPTVSAFGGGSTPRYAIFGDLDNDGRVEVIYQSSGNGIFIYEWDGVKGSYNFGTKPSQVIDKNTAPGMKNLGGNVEYMESEDVDGDGQNELLVAYNSSPSPTNDVYYIISAVGTWSTNNPGFSSFKIEYEGIRGELGKWGLSGGTPYAMIAADFLGNKKKEILITNWNHKNVTILTPTAPNTYKLADTTNGKQNYKLGGIYDDVALFGGMAFDVDGDGRQEVYLPNYTYMKNANGIYPTTGHVDMIYYSPGQNTNQIDSSNVFVIDFSHLIPNGYPLFGYGYGDIDGNGKPNLYFSSAYPYNIVTAEFQGGDKTNPNNWKLSVLYPGDSTIISSITIKDSAGTSDTTKYINRAFASKIYDHYTDLFKTGHEDMILPYQSINDSIAVTTLKWNSSKSVYDTTVMKLLNPKRWGLRILQGSAITGISVKDIKIITPRDFMLYQNYPNPFNPSTNIRFNLPVKSNITLNIYDVLGNKVATLINDRVYRKGSYQVTWDGRNSNGIKVASGAYIYRLKFGNFSKSKKMILLK